MKFFDFSRNPQDQQRKNNHKFQEQSTTGDNNNKIKVITHQDKYA